MCYKLLKKELPNLLHNRLVMSESYRSHGRLIVQVVQHYLLNRKLFIFPLSLSFMLFQFNRFAEPHSSVGSAADSRTEGRWFDPRLDQYTFRGLMIVIHSSLTAVRCFDKGYVGKQPVAWKEYCSEY